ncbi:hypothetical protein HDV01_005717 [Terramyces sp. JEL0728]|nr:hypothetical protein HDV01_005717 [Terramyces sp. JEL0728]
MRFYLLVISVLCQNSTVTRDIITTANTIEIITTIPESTATIVHPTTTNNPPTIPPIKLPTKPLPPVIIRTTARQPVATAKEKPDIITSTIPPPSPTTSDSTADTTTTLTSKQNSNTILPTITIKPFAPTSTDNSNSDALSTGGIVILVLAFTAMAAMIGYFIYAKKKQITREISKEILSPNSASILPTHSSSSDEVLKPAYPTSRPESLVYMANISQIFERDAGMPYPPLNQFKTHKDVVYETQANNEPDPTAIFDDTSSIYSRLDETDNPFRNRGSQNPFLDPHPETPFEDQFDSNIVSMMSGGQVSRLEVIHEESEEDLFYKSFYSQYYAARRDSSLRRRSISTVHDDVVVPKYFSRNSLDLE